MRRVATKRITKTAAVLARRRGTLFAALGVLAFCARPVACLSDVPLPDCVKQNDCGAKGGSLSDAGAAGQKPEGGNEGGVSGQSSNSGASGMAAGGGGMAGVGEGGPTPDAGEGGESGCGCNISISPLQLTDPCGASLYTSKLYVSGGEAPYEWSVSAPTGTWAVVADSSDSSSANLTGTPNGAANVTVSVTDHRQLVVQRTYALSPRTACYLAYVAPDDNAVSKLTLVDPLLEAAAPITLANNQGVYDFQFSPSGRFLVYRFQDTNSNPVESHLSLVDLSTRKDHPLAFGEDAVTAYAWSADSQFLAVMFSATQDNYLGGIHVTVSAAAAPAQLTPLNPVASSVPAESGLFWLGTAFVSFYATILPGLPNPSHRITAFTAQLDASGFEAPQPNEDDLYTAPVVLQPTDTGFFMIVSGATPGTGFHTVGLDAYSAEHGTDWVAPSGNFTAHPSGDTLQVFNAGDDDLNDGSIAAADGCEKILSWASNRERIACVQGTSDTDAGTAGGEIRIFDLLSANAAPSLTTSTVLGSCSEPTGGTPVSDPCPAPEYFYDKASSELEPRLLSPSGRWFAFMTNTQQALPGEAYLSWADLNSQPITITRTDSVYLGTNQTPIRNVLAFSPDERYLLLQSGNLLSLRLLDAEQNTGIDSQASVIDAYLLSPPQAAQNCSEDFGAAPLDWCGAANRASSFAWSPDSKRFAYRTSNQLTVIDQASITFFTPHRFNMAACSSDQCSGQFAFQPQP
jgi:hypothetical protein